MEIQALTKKIEDLKDSFSLFQSEIQVQDLTKGRVHQRLDTLDNLIRQLQSSHQPVHSHVNTMHTMAETRESIQGEEFGKDLANKLMLLQQEVEGLKSEFGKWMKEFQDILNQKADLAQLSALEKLLMDRINDIVKGLTK